MNSRTFRFQVAGDEAWKPSMQSIRLRFVLTKGRA